MTRLIVASVLLWSLYAGVLATGLRDAVQAQLTRVECYQQDLAQGFNPLR